MKEWLFIATDYAVTLINWAALIVIVVGAVEAFFQAFGRCSPRPTATWIPTCGCVLAAGW